MHRFLTSLILAVVGAATVRAGEITAEGREFFESKIRPVLVTECYDCHGPKKAKGGLRLDSRESILQGGDSGPSLVPGDPDKSLLIQSLAHTHEDEALHMPKDGAKLDDATLKHFVEWIRLGAPDPRDKPEPVLTAEQTWEQTLTQRKQWWCFQPVKEPPQPAVQDQAWSQHPVDRFILAKIEASGLQPAADAGPAVLLRRLHYILTGLPPNEEELAAFQQVAAQDLQQAVEQTADRLIASPQFGEKWARHWLDWVRYAETYGSEGDAPIPYAWRYRDYVIRAFNDDVPYPQMVREAIAGDLLPEPRWNAQTGLNESATGIGQLRMVLHGFSPTDSLDEMVTFTDNQIDTVTKAFQALTVSCARCHNHKFDAISQADFYALYGIFTSTHPAVVDVNPRDAAKAQREELPRLKGQIQQAVGQAWLQAAAALPTVTHETKPQPSLNVQKRWDLHTEKWFTDGNGLAPQPERAGSFAIATEGQGIIARIHPAGYASNLLSTKDRAVLMSPRFNCEGGSLWMRVAGGGGSKAKYVVQNYPRTGTIHKAKELINEADAAPGWHRLDLDYWKGDEIFIQVATAADMPAEVKEDSRSWFTLSEVLITEGDAAPVTPPPSGNPREAVAAWLDGTITDMQAELLDDLLRKGKLPNDPEKIPAAAPLLARYREIEAALPLPTRTPGVLEADPKDAALFVRGDHKQPAQLIQRRFLDGINPAPCNPAHQSGRLELAKHLTDPANPLTSRVIVNRLWHHVFGAGLVSTPDNFGRLGEQPSHPELLDALATAFDRQGGSLKKMIRHLVTSRTFRLSDAASDAARQKDPQNRLLSHWTVRRMEAEALRDSILMLSGQLELTPFGPPVAGKDPRRSVYVRVIRNNLDPFLTAFDMPVPSSTRGRRDVTNVPAQSLALLNDPSIIQWTAQWARGVLKAGQDDERVRQLFLQALAREPSAEETAASLQFVAASEQEISAQQQQLARLEEQRSGLDDRIGAMLTPLRQKLTQQQPVAKPVSAPVPWAEWDFEKDAKDTQGRLDLTLEGGARIEGGALVLDGRKAHARSGPLPIKLRAKTLEAWVLLDDLDQRGGGLLTVQDLRGDVFDSIVFGEKEARMWMAGSDFGKRTRPFGGPAEAEAAKRPVHIALVYNGGKITCYRDGVGYGDSYKNDADILFQSGAAQVLLGCRHGAPTGNRMLRGRILRARLYDRSLNSVEIEASRMIEPTVITDRDVLDALSPEDRTRVLQWQADREKLLAREESLRTQLTKLRPESAGWESLALSLINLKEFLYLR